MRTTTNTLLLLLLSLFMVSCFNNFPEQTQPSQKENAEKTFGYQFDVNHDWCTTINGSITVHPKSGTKLIQVLVYSADNDESTSLKVLNSAEGDKTITLNYDTPSKYVGLYVACITEDGYYTMKKFEYGDREVNFEKESKARTRGASTSSNIDFPYTLPTIPLTLTGPFDSYGKQRGWNNVTLYAPENEEQLIMEVPDFDTDFALTMKQIIFSYFKNGRTYKNIEMIKKTGIYNDNAYPITTGEEDPIILCPIYRNDGTSKEVENSEIYYYYFKANEEPDLKNLKCYRAITLKNSMKANDVLSRFHAYALIYWDENGNGSFKFPAGYKIGFMLRCNLSDKNKRGEQWGDGRMNNEINKYGHFKSSGLGDGDPRMAWLTVNGVNILCCESGSDQDTNESIIQVTGSVETVDIPPYIEKNFYTFLFEDTKSEFTDYDLQDVVIKSTREDNTHIRYILMASGANDELYLHQVNGEVINQNVEVHKIFGSDSRGFINTETKNYPYVEDLVTVSPSFSFLDPNCQPILENRTRGYRIQVSRTGEAPMAIMIPYDFKWSKERIRIDRSYPLFGNWGRNMIESTDWYLYPEDDLVINP